MSVLFETDYLSKLMVVLGLGVFALNAVLQQLRAQDKLFLDEWSLRKRTTKLIGCPHYSISCKPVKVFEMHRTPPWVMVSKHYPYLTDRKKHQ